MIVEVESGVELAVYPFCGQNPVLRVDKMPTKNNVALLGQGPGYWVKCTNRECSVSPHSSGSAEEAVERWNHRV